MADINNLIIICVLECEQHSLSWQAQSMWLLELCGIVLQAPGSAASGQCAMPTASAIEVTLVLEVVLLS